MHIINKTTSTNHQQVSTFDVLIQAEQILDSWPDDPLRVQDDDDSLPEQQQTQPQQQPVEISDNSSNSHKKTKTEDHHKYAKDVEKLEQPKRPLSAYNLFFQVERENILNGEPDQNYNFDNLARVAKIHHDQQHNKGKRKHRKTHGVIGFGELARTVANKWKALDPEIKAMFEQRALIEKKRYQKELDDWANSKLQPQRSLILQSFTLDNNYQKDNSSRGNKKNRSGMNHRSIKSKQQIKTQQQRSLQCGGDNVMDCSERTQHTTNTSTPQYIPASPTPYYNASYSMNNETMYQSPHHQHQNNYNNSPCCCGQQQYVMPSTTICGFAASSSGFMMQQPYVPFPNNCFNCTTNNNNNYSNEYIDNNPFQPVMSSNVPTHEYNNNNNNALPVMQEQGVAEQDCWMEQQQPESIPSGTCSTTSSAAGPTAESQVVSLLEDDDNDDISYISSMTGGINTDDEMDDLIASFQV